MIEKGNMEKKSLILIADHRSENSHRAFATAFSKRHHPNPTVHTLQKKSYHLTGIVDGKKLE